MAGFNTAVTGLSAASTNLDVIGNNIANASTTGFKSSRTEFADLYTTAVVGAGSSNVAGAGVTVSDIAQDFSAGTIEFTNNNLDLAIDGSGFFQLADDTGSLYYTRAGEFELDDEGYIVSKDGKYVQGYGVADPSSEDISLTPVGNLQVSETESAPQATTEIDLSFNINDELDAPENEYDRNDSTTYSYSTTVGIYDSLGNQQTVKINMVEQGPSIETHSIDANAIISNDLEISGVTLSGLDTTDLDATDSIYLGTFTLNSETGQYELDATNLTALQEEDERIARVIYVPDENNPGSVLGDIVVEFESQYTDSGDLNVASSGATIQDEVDERSSAEVQTFSIDAAGVTGGTSFNFGGVTITFASNATQDEIGEAIADAEDDILEANPEVESVVYEAGQVVVTYKAEQGNVDDDLLEVVVSSGSDSPFDDAHATNTDGYVVPVSQNGDDSYEGVYRMYAYLNDEELLDIGKLAEPGSSSALGATEEGPILVTFDTSSGDLETLNGESVSSNGQAPLLTIKGADPADPDTEITLDLSDTTQYASDSVVKDSQQNGYPKGDLVGVTFGETGEMVASFSNGQSLVLGVVAIATFDNQAGLTPSGTTQWIVSLDSGNAILNPPGTGLNGTLESAALESSNVDLSSELVALIQAQRDYQANSKTLETMNTVTQTILQI